VQLLLVALITAAGVAGVAAQTDDGSADAVALFNAAQDLHEHGDLAGAIELYDRALKAVPEFPEAEYQRAVAELALGRRDEAESSLRRALQFRAEWSPAMTLLGSILVDAGQYAEAETLLSKALGSHPQNSPALAAMVELRLKTKASPAALQELLAEVTELTVKANPTSASWSARAALESALGKRDAARTSLAKALAVDPQDRSALFQSAELALEDGDVVRAREAAKALEKLGADVDALKRAITLAGGEATPTDVAGLEKQLETDPKNTSVLNRLCTMLRRDAPLKAADYCRRASEAEPSNVVPAIGYAAALVQAKQFDTAVFILQKLIKIAPDNSTAHANLATALFELNRYEDARAEYEWLTLKQPKLAAAYYFLAVCYDRLGKELDAMANYQLYLRLADPAVNKIDIDKVNLRLAQLQKKRK
jgi:tetratricopeptide (TPR) repeat protein